MCWHVCFALLVPAIEPGQPWLHKETLPPKTEINKVPPILLIIYFLSYYATKFKKSRLEVNN